MIIAIDGPAGSGKSSTAKGVARALGILHLDTGAMYRAVTLKCLRLGAGYGDSRELGAIMERTGIDLRGEGDRVSVLLDGEDVTEQVRSDEVTRWVSDYCKPAVVREALVARQREMGENRSVVCEGRDIGTVVFPGAVLKFFITATVEERARRRQKDFERIGVSKSLEGLVEELRLRDEKDSSRELSPLKKAADAREIDTTGLSLEQQVELIVEAAREVEKLEGFAVSDARPGSGRAGQQEKAEDI